MLVILKEPIKGAEYDTIAVNLKVADEIIVSKINNRFGLSILRHFDGHYSNQSFLPYTLDTFDAYEPCLELFQKLVDVLKSGQQVLDLRSGRLSDDDLPQV